MLSGESSTLPRQRFEHEQELCEERIALGLLGDPQACEEARILRFLITDRIQTIGHVPATRE